MRERSSRSVASFVRRSTCSRVVRQEARAASPRRDPRPRAARGSRRARRAACAARATRSRRTPCAPSRAARAGRACGRTPRASSPELVVAPVDDRLVEVPLARSGSAARSQPADAARVDGGRARSRARARCPALRPSRRASGARRARTVASWSASDDEKSTTRSSGRSCTATSPYSSWPPRRSGAPHRAPRARRLHAPRRRSADLAGSRSRAESDSDRQRRRVGVDPERRRRGRRPPRRRSRTAASTTYGLLEHAAPGERRSRSCPRSSCELVELGVDEAALERRDDDHVRGRAARRRRWRRSASVELDADAAGQAHPSRKR